MKEKRKASAFQITLIDADQTIKSLWLPQKAEGKFRFSGNESDAWYDFFYIEGREEKWYAVDVTWDDPLIENGRTLNNENRYQYFLKGANEFFKDHKENGKFVENSIEFKFPTLSQWGRSFS